MNVRRLVLAVLCTMTGALVCSAAPALAATNNVYSSQFNGSLTLAGSFAPSALAVNSSGDVYVADYNVVDEFNPEGTAVLAEFNGGKTAAESFYPTGLAVNSSGNVYVDAGNLVDEFSPTAPGESEPKPMAEFNGGKTEGTSFCLL